MTFILFFEVFYLCHIFSCVWYGSTTVQEENWITAYDLQDLSISQKYLRSLYFAIITITTIGYGDFTATTDLERMVVGLMALMSSGVFAYIVSMISDMIKEKRNK
jgi:hypothetical protein